MLISLFGIDYGNKLGPDNREFRIDSTKRTFLFTILYDLLHSNALECARRIYHIETDTTFSRYLVGIKLNFLENLNF